MDIQNEQHSILEWRALVDEIDENGDGEISYGEFKSLMRELLLGAPRQV